MSDLISRSALIEKLQKYFVNNSIHKNDLAEILANFPIVEAKPVVHGEWIEFDAEANEWSCSKCGHIWQLNDGTPEENCMNFCTKCGAVMRKKVKECD